MKPLLILIFICLTFYSSQGQWLHDYNKRLKIEFLQKQIVGTDAGFEVPVKVFNSYDSSLLLYSFNSPEDGETSEGWYEEPNRTSGMAVFVSSAKSKWVKLEMDVYQMDHYHPVVTAIDSVQYYATTRMIVLPAKGTLETKIPVKLVKGKIAKGEYQLRLIYYCGYYVPNLVKKERIAEDEKKYKAMLYQGYVKTGKVILIIK
jgi:hypothetical protein